MRAVLSGQEDPAEWGAAVICPDVAEQQPTEGEFDPVAVLEQPV
jgi:hypothetical protein